MRLAELVVALDDRLRNLDLQAFLTRAADAAELSADLGADDTPPGPALQRWTIEMGAVAGLGADCAFDVLIANLHGPAVMLGLLVQRGAPGGATSETVDVDAALALGRSLVRRSRREHGRIASACVVAVGGRSRPCAARRGRRRGPRRRSTAS